jgi:hypothetical protein
VEGERDTKLPLCSTLTASSVRESGTVSGPIVSVAGAPEATCSCEAERMKPGPRAVTFTLKAAGNSNAE